MKKILTIVALLCASVMGWAAINWDEVDYLGSTDPSISMNTYKYSLDPDDSESGPNSIANIQPASGESRLGFYSTYGQGVASCSHEAKILGDQVWLYVDQLTKKDTKITVTLADASTRAFHLYYKNGSDGTPVDPSAPHASGKGFGTYVAKNVPFYPRVDNKADDTQDAYGTTDLFIVTYGNKMMAKAKLNDSKTFGGNGYSMQFRIWNDAQSSFGEYWAQLREENNTVAVIDMSSNYCNLNQGTRTELPINTYMETNAGTGAVPMFMYTLDYINTPIVGDETAPVISSATASNNPLDNNPTITITATDANDIFYKVVAPDNSISYSFSNVINLTTDGSNDIVTYHCYAIDFNGNISTVSDVNVQMKPALSNIALNKAVIAGVNQSTAGRIVDGNFNGDRWSSQGAVHYAADPENYQDWFYINFVNVYDLSAVRIKWENARPNNYTFRTSIDGVTWTVVKTFTEYPAGNATTDYILPANTQGRYFGVWATSGFDNLNYGISPFEVEVYGSPAVLDDHNPPTLTSAELSGEPEWNQVHIVAVGTDHEDGAVVSFHVLDATNSIDQVCVATAGVITVTGLAGETEYNFSVTALDNAGNESATAIVVNVTTPIDTTVPLVAAPVPDGTGKDVLPIYSDAFSSILAHDFDKDGWAGVPLMEEKNISGNHCLVYNVASANEVIWGMYDNSANAIIADEGYHSATGMGVDASAMTNLHLDIWSLQPCTNAINICINDAALKTLRLSHAGTGWQSYDISLSDFNEGEEGKRIDNVRWFKFNGIGPISGKMALDNVYFWTPATGMKAVSASSNNTTMGSAVVKQGDDEVNSVAEDSEVSFIATPNEGYVFVNWTNLGTEVSTEATYVTTITETTNLVANFDYVRTIYCHTEILTNSNKKLYLSVSKVADNTYQIRVDGSSEAKINGRNNFNFVINHTNDYSNESYNSETGHGWLVSNEGYGYIVNTFSANDYKTLSFGSHYFAIGAQGGGELVLDNNFPAVTSIAWNSTCADAEAPVFAKAEGAVLDANSVRLTIQATDNWEGMLTYTIAREGAEPIISNHASGEEFTQDVTGLTTGTEYTFTVTVSDGVNNTNRNIVVTPVGDETKPVMGDASLESKTWNSAIINVAATDNIGVASYYIVELDAEYVASEGKISVEGLTQGTAYSFTIKAKDGAGNISDNSAEVNFTTDAHLSAPTTAASVPTWPANQVKSIYSDTYTFAPASLNSYNETWWDRPNMAEGDVEGNHYLNYDLYRTGMIGAEFGEISVALMEKVHIDIWASIAGSVTFRPITNGGPSTPKTLNLTAQEWASFDIDLTEFVGHDWSKLFQFAIEAYGVGGLVGDHICVDNVYFYRTTPPPADATAPTNVTANVIETSFTSVKISAQADDDSGIVHFKVMNGSAELVSDVEAVSGVATTLTVSGLTPNTSYSLKVIAFDEAGHEAAPVIAAATTQTLPPAAPQPSAGGLIVLSVYCDAFEPAVAASFRKNNWGSASVALEADYLLYTMTANVIVWGNNDGNAGYGNIDGLSGHTYEAKPGLDVSEMKYLHFDVWCDAANQLNTVNINDVAVTIPTTRTIAGEWVSFDVDITGVALADRQNVRWMKFHPFNATNCNAAIDNVYFWTYGATTNVDNWASFASPETVQLSDGITAYKAVYSNNGGDEVLTLYELEDGIIPANAGVLLRSTETSSVHAFTTTNATPATDMSDNNLVGCTVRTDVSAEREENDIFCLRRSDLFDQTAFFLYEGQYVPAGKAYLPLPKQSGAAGASRRVRFVFDTATSLDENATDAAKVTKFIENGQLFIRRGDKVYTIQGVPVE